jgi:hypothetical protein
MVTAFCCKKGSGGWKTSRRNVFDAMEEIRTPSSLPGQ